MPRIKNVGCTVNIDNVPLEEYPDTDAGDDQAEVPTSTVYIKAVEGKEFEIELTCYDGSGIFPGADCLGLSVTIDGKTRNSNPVTPEMKAFPVTLRVDGFDVYENGLRKMQKLMFSNLDVSEDVLRDNMTKDEMDQLGQIKISVRRGIVRGITEQNGEYKLAENLKAVNEKNLKGKGLRHVIAFSEPTKTEQVDFFKIDYLETISKPYMIFRFLYRSENFLKSIGLIPYTPSQSPLPVNSDEEEDPPIDDGSLSREELFNQLQKYKRALNTKAKIKREDDASSSSAGPSNTKRRRVKIETIDLTDD